MRHGALKGIHQQYDAVGHVEHTFNLAAEIGVTRGIYDVDFVIFVFDRDIFCQDGDTTFALNVVIVHYKVACLVLFAEKFALENHFVDKGGFAVVDVGNDCNVSEFKHLKVL